MCSHIDRAWEKASLFVRVLAICLFLGCSGGSIARAEFIWIEGEKPAHATVTRHPWWYDKVQRDKLSGGDYISNWDEKKAGEAQYGFTVATGGSYEFWVRANPMETSLSYQLNGGKWTPIDTEHNRVDLTNIAENNALDIRFIAWLKVGQVALTRGNNQITFRFDSKNNNHGSLDCFVFSTEAFEPHGIAKPGDPAAKVMDEEKGWFPFDPATDAFTDSPMSMRFLNEPAAGDGGFIAVKDGEFVHSKTGEPVRFWGVNGPPADLSDPEGLGRVARTLAKHGVNLVRVHGGYFDEAGNVDPKKVQRAIDVVEAMKAQGIYCHFSIYFYLWLHPKAGTPWLDGYDGTKPAPGALFFNPAFQQKYQEWWKALLLTPSAKTGKRLVDEPAVFGAEILNEDSCFFWTFNADAIPDAELRIMESAFATWLKDKYGSLQTATDQWKGISVHRDAPTEGRMGFRPTWQMIKERSRRDQDTAEFFAQTQLKFYRDTVQFLHGIGFKGVITASNWTTASEQYFGELEKYSYTSGDFLDRHDYWNCETKGDSDAWSIRSGQTYIDRSALRFDPKVFGGPKLISGPIMDPHYDGKPSMLSETAFNRPNRYRSEAPIYHAVYGSLQGSNSVEHFALDGAGWNVKPNYFMQPWTLMSPAMMGQFPAAAMIYRQKLIGEGALLADLNLNLKELYALHGSPQGLVGEFEEGKTPDKGPQPSADSLIDPLICFAGRTSVRFSDGGGQSTIQPLAPYIDRAHRTVTSTNGQLKLDYEKGMLAINAPSAQGISGALAKAGAVQLADVSVSSPMELGHIVVVSLDGKPLAKSERMLLQVMSEEKANHFQTIAADEGRTRIVGIGQDPWMVKELAGTVKFNRADAADLKVMPLDFNGYPKKLMGNAGEIQLQADALYYLISR